MKRKYNVLENEYYEYSMQKFSPPRLENTIEAQVQDGDTLQALALKFHCSVAEIKRLNKIDKDNEIYARKTIKVPLTPHTVLLETQPIVHKSGQSTPKKDVVDANTDPLSKNHLSEKLIIASVNSSEIINSNNGNSTINDIILNSRVTHNTYRDDDDKDPSLSHLDALLSGEIDETIPHPRLVPGPSKGIFDCSGSDFDMSWICLFICILALCFAIPLIYVFYVTEHPEKFHHSSN